jgi:hypothetical protein
VGTVESDCYALVTKWLIVTTGRGALRERTIAPIYGMKEEDIREAQLDEDHHTRLRYLSWFEKVDDKWERHTATLRAGETHPILNARKSLENNSRLT